MGVDAFTDYYPRPLKRGNLLAAVSGGRAGRFWLVEGDLLTLDLDALLGGVDRIVHLAAEPGVRGSFGERSPLYVERNVDATRALLEAALRSGVLRFVHASSSSVYGPAPGRLVREDDRLRPASPYAHSKLASEHLVRLYAYKGLPATVLRYFTVYGPRQRPDMAISRFISRAREGRELEVFGDGSQVRELTYVADAVDATVAALFSGGDFDTYNVGGGGRASVGELVDLVSAALGREVRARYLPEAQGDVPATRADCDKAGCGLGYSPETTLEEGVGEQVRWLAEREALGA